MGLNLCDRCSADCRHHRDPNEIVVKCGAFKPPMTNADRIRAMSDEELLDFMKKSVANAYMCKIMRTEPMFLTLEWLQQPVKEDTTC